MLPLSTIDKPIFCTMLQKFNSKYVYFTKVAIPFLVSSVCDTIETEIANKELDYFSVTTDLQTSAQQVYANKIKHLLGTYA